MRDSLKTGELYAFSICWPSIGALCHLYIIYCVVCLQWSIHSRAHYQHILAGDRCMNGRNMRHPQLAINWVDRVNRTPMNIVRAIIPEYAASKPILEQTNASNKRLFTSRYYLLVGTRSESGFRVAGTSHDGHTLPIQFSVAIFQLRFSRSQICPTKYTIFDCKVGKNRTSLVYDGGNSDIFTHRQCHFTYARIYCDHNMHVYWASPATIPQVCVQPTGVPSFRVNIIYSTATQIESWIREKNVSFAFAEHNSKTIYKMALCVCEFVRISNTFGLSIAILRYLLFLFSSCFVFPNVQIPRRLIVHRFQTVIFNRSMHICKCHGMEYSLVRRSCEHSKYTNHTHNRPDISNPYRLNCVHRCSTCSSDLVPLSINLWWCRVQFCLADSPCLCAKT